MNFQRKTRTFFWINYMAYEYLPCYIMLLVASKYNTYFALIFFDLKRGNGRANDLFRRDIPRHKAYRHALQLLQTTRKDIRSSRSHQVWNRDSVRKQFMRRDEWQTKDIRATRKTVRMRHSRERSRNYRKSRGYVFPFDFIRMYTYSTSVLCIYTRVCPGRSLAFPRIWFPFESPHIPDSSVRASCKDGNWTDWL